MKNISNRFGEIDLLGVDSVDRVVQIVEVKYRVRLDRHFYPIDRFKVRKIMKCFYTKNELRRFYNFDIKIWFALCTSVEKKLIVNLYPYQL